MTNSKKENKKKIFIIILIVLLLGLAVGYAAFADTLNISGTANASGSFDIEFNSAKVVTSAGVNETETKATISEDKNTLTVTVKDLAYPGAGAQFQAVIKNVGTVPAKVKAVTPTNIDGNGNAIVIKGLDAITTSHPVLAPNGTCTIDFTVEWDPDVTTLDETKAGEGKDDLAELSFNLEIEYEQDTTQFTGTQGHT